MAYKREIAIVLLMILLLCGAWILITRVGSSSGAAAGTDRKRDGKTAAKASPAPAATETGRGIVRTAILTDL